MRSCVRLAYIGLRLFSLDRVGTRRRLDLSSSVCHAIQRPTSLRWMRFRSFKGTRANNTISEPLIGCVCSFVGSNRVALTFYPFIHWSFRTEPIAFRVPSSQQSTRRDHHSVLFATDLDSDPRSKQY